MQILVNVSEKYIKDCKAMWQAERVQVHRIVWQELFYCVL